MAPSAHDRLTAALLQGGMPRLFVPGVLSLFDHLVAEALAAHVGRAFPASQPLTQRERAWLQAKADGADTGQIIAAMGVQPSTVKTYAHSAVQKLGARTCPHAVAQGVRAGVIA